jgi:hypothetical protein
MRLSTNLLDWNELPLSNYPWICMAASGHPIAIFGTLIVSLLDESAWAFDNTTFNERGLFTSVLRIFPGNYES